MNQTRSSRGWALGIALSLVACTGGTDDAGLTTDYGDGTAHAWRDGDALHAELFVGDRDEAAATLVVAADGSRWSDGATTYDVVADSALDAGDLLARGAPAQTFVAALPAAEQEANDLLHTIYIGPPPLDQATPIPFEDGCNGYDWDNMVCVTCTEGGTYCYVCTWEDDWGFIHQYGSCSGGGGKNPFHDSP